MSANAKTPIRLYLVDGSAYIFRAYHALPPLTRKSDGMPIGAVSGFSNMLYKLLTDMVELHDPTHFAVIFDYSSKTFRNEIYSEYKANRPPPPEDLRPQFALVRDATRAFNAPCIEMEGYEADDLIATYAREVERQGGETVIVSSDKDLMQLVSDKTTMFDPMKNKLIGPDEVVEKFGLGPDHVVDIQALAGDSSDNVPGVPGIGVKTAAQLISEYGDLETLLARASEIKQNKRRENLIEFADQARLSKVLVTLKTDVPLTDAIDQFGVRPIDRDRLLSFLDEMEFTTLTRRVSADLGADESTGEIAPAPPSGAADYETVFDEARLQIWIDKAYERGVIAVDTETDSLNAMRANLVGVCLSVKTGEACYIPLGHGGDGLALDDEDAARQIKLEKALALLKPMFEDPSILKVGQNIKYDALVLSKYGVSISPVDDTMLISYALDCGKGGNGMDELAKRHLDYDTIKFSDVAGSGKKAKTFDQIPIKEASKYAAEDADITLRLYEILKPRLAAEGKTTVYETLERPLVPVIVAMERE
ncbi:DNA polymerase I, partial [hydrothermal vent metagenome]